MLKFAERESNIGSIMTFPQLPPLREREFEPGLGDEVEKLLYTIKMGALNKLIVNPKLDMIGQVEQDLRGMLKQALEKNDLESANMFQSALNRVSRVD